jgi:hypothetical protein
MTTTTDPTDPTTPTPAAACARPWHPSRPAGCARCHRTTRPHRARGLCGYCYVTLFTPDQRDGTRLLDDYPPVGWFKGRQTVDAAIESHIVSGTLRALDRAWARQDALRDTAGPFITVALSTGRAPVPLPDNGDTGGWGGLCDGPWKPAAWHRPLAERDDARRAA